MTLIGVAAGMCSENVVSKEHQPVQFVISAYSDGLVRVACPLKKLCLKDCLYEKQLQGG